MKKIYPILSLITLFFIALTPVFAQFPMVGTPTTAIQSPKGNVKISGVLIDSRAAAVAAEPEPGKRELDSAGL